MDFTEKLILKSMLADKNYFFMVSSVFQPDFFQSKLISEVFKISKEHFEKYETNPDLSIIKNSINSELKDEFDILIDDLNQIDFNLADNYKYLIDKTNEYLKEQSMKQAILKSVDIINNKGNKSLIEELVKNALSKDLMIDLGLNYFSELGSRLKRMFEADKNRIPTYYPQFDEYLNGGFPSFTLNFIIGQIHGWKSASIDNIASRQVLNGHNVVVTTMEMCQDAYAKRFDAVFTSMDINRMYLPESRKKLVKKLKDIKEGDHGLLFIKHFPTGEATRNDIRAYLRELNIRGIKVDILYVDYINIMKGTLSSSRNLYESVKSIAEELRSLSFEFNIPVFSVSQLNREGGMISFNDTSFYHISECLDKNTIVYKKDIGKTRISDINVGDQIKGSSGYVNVLRIDLKRKKKYKIKTKSGKEIICSINHKFPSDKGILSISDGLRTGDKLFVKNLETNFDDKIIEIIDMDNEDLLIDIEVDHDHFFYANDILTKNSIGVPATADFMAIFGRNADDMVYENEIHYKIVKNRLGGRIGQVDKFYFDSRSLKMYDVTEIDDWLRDVEISGDTRNIIDTEE